MSWLSILRKTYSSPRRPPPPAGRNPVGASVLRSSSFSAPGRGRAGRRRVWSLSLPAGPTARHVSGADPGPEAEGADESDGPPDSQIEAEIPTDTDTPHLTGRTSPVSVSRSATQGTPRTRGGRTRALPRPPCPPAAATR
ncbi:hypothetical protein PVAP13_2KG170358 [Panicum virgatum]|uniref:Uncharacterized protein n=1 Tax=Panicum virgatum TaxID=38727 RepID=A0A8T0W9G4_PANVG|nr:hypothetical protein PVAP13_2KG170358 [Panicum virgatum]